MGTSRHQERSTGRPGDPASPICINQTVVFDISLSTPKCDWNPTSYPATPIELQFAKLQARAAQLEVSNALFKEENSSLKAERTQLKRQLSMKTKQARDQKQEARELTKRAEQADDSTQRLKERIVKWKKTAFAAQQQASRALSSRSKRVSVSADGTPRPVHRVQAPSGANGGKRMALDEVITLTQGSFFISRIPQKRMCVRNAV
jgi:hypothetical protein